MRDGAPAQVDASVDELRDGDEFASWLDQRSFAVDAQRARMLVTSERLLGREHPDTLWAAHDLATALLRAGEAALARCLAEHLVDVRTRLLGPEHAYTARARELLRTTCER